MPPDQIIVGYYFSPVCLHICPQTYSMSVIFYPYKMHCSHFVCLFLWTSSFRWHHCWPPCDLDNVPLIWMNLPGMCCFTNTLGCDSLAGIVVISKSGLILKNNWRNVCVSCFVIKIQKRYMWHVIAHYSFYLKNMHFPMLSF